MCIDPKTMQPTGGKCCGEPKMRLPGCPLCDDDGCCPEHCCDWYTEPSSHHDAQNSPSSCCMPPLHMSSHSPCCRIPSASSSQGAPPTDGSICPACHLAVTDRLQTDPHAASVSVPQAGSDSGFHAAWTLSLKALKLALALLIRTCQSVFNLSA